MCPNPTLCMMLTFLFFVLSRHKSLLHAFVKSRLHVEFIRKIPSGCFPRLARHPQRQNEGKRTLGLFCSLLLRNETRSNAVCSSPSMLQSTPLSSSPSVLPILTLWEAARKKKGNTPQSNQTKKSGNTKYCPMNMWSHLQTVIQIET